MEEIIKNNLKVLVVGGGKSGCDMVCAFQKTGYKQLTWLFRSPYWFLKYDAVAHGGFFLDRLRGFLFLFSLLLFLVSNTLPLFLGWLIGYFILPKSEGTESMGPLFREWPCPSPYRWLAGNGAWVSCTVVFPLFPSSPL